MKLKRLHRRILAAGLGLLVGSLLASCAVNPVTGEHELSLVSEEQELQLGKKNYGPYRQAQGGDYEADPELVKYVKRVGQRVAKHADRKLPYEFEVVNDSTPNAWALPGGKIALNRGLLVELQSEAELAAVLGHEIVHAAARHSAQSMERGILFQGALLAAGVALADTDYAQAGMLGAQLGAAAGQQHYSREAEREADHYGIHYMVRAGYDPAAAVELQKTFVRLSEGHAQSWLDGLFASHPPSPERVENNRKLVAELGNPGGELGRKRYKKAIARLIRTKPAYDAYDKALVAFEKKDHAKALKLVNKAIRIEPGEALFRTLRGEIHEARGKNKKALKNYNKAMSLNPNYYRIPLARGLLQRKMGRTEAARKDLKRSNQLLPTAEGQYGLGMIARNQGNSQQAASHFRVAAQSQSSVGQAAVRQLQKLGNKGRPAPSDLVRAISPIVGLNRQDKLVVRLTNISRVPLAGVRFKVIERSGGRQYELGEFRVKPTIPAHGHINKHTGLGPMQEHQLRHIAVVVVQARVAGR